MKIGDKVLIRGCVDEIRKDCVIIRNEGGYFGTVASEIIGVKADAVPVIRCKDCKFAHITDGVYGNNPEVKYCDIWFPNVSEYMPINYYCASAERKDEWQRNVLNSSH